MKINIPKAKIEAKVTAAFKNTLPELCEEILNDCNQYCKEADHGLIDSSYTHSEPRNGKLIWQTPYAKRQYWEIETAHKDKNPHATWKWCEVAKRHHLDRWTRQEQALLERSMK